VLSSVWVHWQSLESVWKIRADPRFVPDRIRR
jgi:hypothetical protein